MPESLSHHRNPVPIIGLIAGAISFIVIFFFCDFEPGHPEVTKTAAVAVLMAIWWITEAIPLYATALLPVVLFPFLGVIDGKKIASVYVNHMIFLFIGGFLVALAMERWNLHKRIALKVLLWFGIKPQTMLLGFMSATAFLSMWISNTATTMMMVPIALAIILKLEELSDAKTVKTFSIALFLGIAYSASIGGFATLVGTPPNIAFKGFFEVAYPNAPKISFAEWMMFALPISLTFLLLVWILLQVFFSFRKIKLDFDLEYFKQKYTELGPMSFEEIIVFADFVILALLWLFRKDLIFGGYTIPGWSNLFGNPKFLNDGVVAILMAVILFIVPSKNEKDSRILNSDIIFRLPWNLVLLFGGGFALAKAFESSGLSNVIGSQLTMLQSYDLHPIFIIAIISTLITFLTELTSNTATAYVMLPVISTLAVALNLNPLLIMIPATLSASCAFMLPVATPPNLIVFGTNRIKIREMVKAGILFNFLGVFIISIMVYYIGSEILNIDVTTMPDWALSKGNK